MSLSVTSGMIAQDCAARLPNLMAIAPAGQGSATTAAQDDVHAIAAALTLCAFLWGLKAFLIAWYLTVKQINPLSDAPVDGALAFGGADLFFCAALAVLYRCMFGLARRLPQPFDFILRTPATFAIHAAVVVFSVASFEVTRIYGWPLDVSHLRSADDPRIIASSIGAYAGLLPCVLIVIGVLMRPLLGRPIEALLSRGRTASARAWRAWAILAAVTGILFGGWALRLRGIDTFGVKQNAVIYFVQHYKLAPGPIEVQRTMQDLAQGLSGGENARMDDAKSLTDADGKLKRDFPLDASTSASARGMNLLVIQLESTSAAYLDEKTTPNLMRLAKSGLSFRNHATVFSETTRATYGIYYSDYLLDLGTTPRLLYGAKLPQPSLPETLHAAGYETALFHSGFLSYADESYLFENKGVDHIVDAGDLWAKGTELPWSWGVREEQTVDALTSWLAKRSPGKPFCAIYSTEFPHHPYVCPIDDKPYPETGWLNRYRNSLHYADRSIGTLIDKLAAGKQLDNTIIVVMGDHGETVSSYPVGHGLALTREEVFTPFIVSNPKLFPAALSSQLSTNHLDIAPTVAHLLGVKAPPQWLGRNLIADEIPARVLFVQAKLAQIHGVIDNGLLYVYETGRKRGQLFDTSGGVEMKLTPSGAQTAELMPRYRAMDESFQKWAVWRHLARATGQLDEAATARQHNAAVSD